ncbi:hypothetical protein L873DRAFT_1809575 [Choiromyces venosus 120613-1]|uniref:Uncharacterized protein n=1 Tax=Choiromyces venosus 120613-1 TaxID=1336337 RepID=A0A3N4JGX7_9PEZI|nr:hypothetical protein L873DRAFT_1809575 [Choiromyces venosus 120613-1]
MAGWWVVGLAWPMVFALVDYCIVRCCGMKEGRNAVGMRMTVLVGMGMRGMFRRLWVKICLIFFLFV